MKSQYTAKDIQHLTGNEHVRKRPGMYIGGTDQRALHHMVYEVLDHVAEEVFIDKCSEAELVLRDNGEVILRDNSEGLPTAIDEESGLPQLQLLMTSLLARKENFDNKRYTVTGGLHGVGLSAVNALCEWMKVEVRRDGFLWEQRYSEGKPITKLKKVRPLKDGESTGTTFRFQPDYTIMESIPFDFDTLARRCRELAYLMAGFKLIIRDERTTFPHREEVFYSSKGLLSLLDDLRGQAKPLHKPVYLRTDALITLPDREPYTIGIEFVFQFTSRSVGSSYSYVNTVMTVNGGVHLSALRDTILKVINLPTKRRKISMQELMQGLIAVISVRHPDPQFESPTKVKLYNPEIGAIVGRLILDECERSGFTKPEVLKPILKHLSQS